MNDKTTNSAWPAQEKVRSIWTTGDEAKLQELRERKERVMKERREELVEQLAGAFPSRSGAYTAADALIPNANALMRALEPFSDFTLTPRSQT